MRKSIVVVIVIQMMMTASAFANSAPVISNVQASQRGDASKVVDIYYTLADADNDVCTVWMAVSDNGGTSWKVPAENFTGAVGPGISPGGGKHVVWDAGSDMPGKTGSNFRVRVYADDGHGPAAKVLVSAGYFPYQNTTNPLAWVFVESFLIDKYETTNAFYCQFLNAADPNGDHWVSGMEILRYGDAGSYYYRVATGKDNYPVRYVNYYDAEAFAQWRSQLEGLSYRLPTGSEWEKAAAWDPATQRYYTYGYHSDSISSVWCNYANAFGGPLPVGSFNGTNGKNDAKSYYGCYDMTGNTWEWTSDVSGIYRVMYGGSSYEAASVCKCTFRYSIMPTYRGEMWGCRLVLDLD